MAVERPNTNYIEGAGIDITLSDNPTLNAVNVQIAATGGGGGGGGDPAADTAVWMPLTTTVGGDDVLVFDADHSLIPTLVTI